MIVAGFSIHDDSPLIHPSAARIGQAKWLVRVFAQDGDTRYSRELRPSERCHLHDLLPLATESVDELLDAAGREVTDAGFQVIRLR